MSRPSLQPALSFKKYMSKLIGQPSMLFAVGAFLLALLSNILASVLGEWHLFGVSGNVIFLILFGLGIIAIYFYHSRKRVVIIEMRERQPTGKAGIILLLSTLNPRPVGTNTTEIKQHNQQVQAAVERIATTQDAAMLTEADFQFLLGTNLEPALRAMEFHHREGTLRECWVIGTEDEKNEQGAMTKRGSAWLAPVLQRWFDHLHPGNMVRFQRPIEVVPRDYATLWKQVDAIFRRGPYRADKIICDVTGGLKLMTVGAALACIEEGRTMQYMATDRDWRGEPIPQGEMRPVLVDVTPYLTAEQVE